jgi:hypothetical protein
MRVKSIAIAVHQPRALAARQFAGSRWQGRNHLRKEDAPRQESNLRTRSVEPTPQTAYLHRLRTNGLPSVGNTVLFSRVALNVGRRHARAAVEERRRVLDLFAGLVTRMSDSRARPGSEGWSRAGAVIPSFPPEGRRTRSKRAARLCAARDGPLLPLTPLVTGTVGSVARTGGVKSEPYLMGRR